MSQLAHLSVFFRGGGVMEIKATTHAARLPVGCQLLQPLGIPEFNKDCDGPLFVVFMRCELQFPCTSNT